MDQNARLEPLRKARASASTFDARFFERDECFTEILPVATLFAEYTDWPSVEAIDRALSDRAGVKFVMAKRRPRRQRGPVLLEDLYDAHIARGEVPTRERNWHDLMNAFVWATFPKSKRALHSRQHAAQREWVRSNAELVDEKRVARLPNARTRELDALALIDEGGVLLNGDSRVIFGHALYEGFVLEVRSMIARGIPLDALTDEALAIRLAEPVTPEILPRVPV